MKQRKALWIILALLLFAACSPQENSGQNSDDNESVTTAAPLFSRVSPSASGLDFQNILTENEYANYFIYQYFYNGGGVAVGDINNDGWADVYLTANMSPDKLFINRGKLTFEDATAAAGIDPASGWRTGVSMADLNQDGFLDIYICRSGGFEDPLARTNVLYINNGDGTFIEGAKEAGLDDTGYSTQAYYLDFDGDDDLDIYLVNHRADFQNNAFLHADFDKEFDHSASDRLYENKGNGKFSDVSDKWGIRDRAWGLSAVIGDFNNDGRDDIYVANDFMQPDLLYINEGNRFREELGDHFRHTSFYSMGSDLADVNNDGLDDLIVLDMVSEDHLRSKRMMASMSTENFRKLVSAGYHHQYMRNVLQLNLGNGAFSEIGQMAGVSATDWSWAPLFADLDNDGLKDLFVTNGIKRDVTDNDFKTAIKLRMLTEGRMPPAQEALGMLPTSKVSNYAFRNTGKLGFESVATVWGLSDAVNSNGAAYADLDKDGDLDLIVNNLDEASGLYENHANEDPDNHYISFKLKGEAPNSFAFGSVIEVFNGTELQRQRLSPVRGFQSSVDQVLHFGLGAFTSVDSVRIQWSNGKLSLMTNIDIDRRWVIRQDSLVQSDAPLKMPQSPLFKEITDESGITFTHKENEFDDFDKEILLPHRQSQLGPLLSSGDANGDGLKDVFVGGASGESGVLYLQQESGMFTSASSQAWKADRQSEDMGSLFFDADDDGDQDLYVVSGGYAFGENDPHLQDRLYLNDGKGNFSRSVDALPEMLSSGSQVAGSDWDGDGDTDLFVGGRAIPGKYPFAPQSYLLQNEGGKFKDVTDEKAPSLRKPGLVTGAVFADIDNDKDDDLVLVGEWMEVTIFLNQKGTFTPASSGIEKSGGWWSSILAGDWDKDGDTDFLLGNLGENNKFHPSISKPLHIYVHDFDNSGSVDIFLAKDLGSANYPVRGMECSSQQMPMIKEKFPSYQAFGQATIEQILGPEEIVNALHYEAHTFSSMLMINDGNGKFDWKPLPVEAQFSQIRGMVSADFNGDGHEDLLIAGNNYGAEVETIRYDASVGLLLTGNGKNDFQPVSTSESGFFAPGDVRSLVLIEGRDDRAAKIIVGNNQGRMQAFEQKHTRSETE